MNQSLRTLLALGCAGTLAATASALPTSYSPGDFLVGFRQVGNTNSVVVDLGPIANFANPQVFTINAGPTLSAQYGSGWASDPNVFSSLAATNAGDRTSYVTSPEYLTGSDVGPATVWSRLTNTNSTIFQNKINNFGGEFTSAGVVQPKTDSNAYANFMPGGTTDAGHATSGNIAWGFFNPTSEGNFSQGTTGLELELIQLVPGAGPGNDLGFFQLSGDGNTLTYTPNVVPEPSAYAATALGALALLGFQMNKARKSSAKEQSA